MELIPTPDQVAKTVCQAFYREVICRHGCPARLLSDQGPQFKSELVEQLCGLFGIKKIFSSTYYPQGDGLAERFMRTLNNSLSILSQSNVEDWDQYVCGVQFAYNSSIHAATGFTPFSLVTGRSPSFPEEGWLRAAQKTQSRPEYLQSLHKIIAQNPGFLFGYVCVAQKGYPDSYRLVHGNAQESISILMKHLTTTTNTGVHSQPPQAMIPGCMIRTNERNTGMYAQQHTTINTRMYSGTEFTGQLLSIEPEHNDVFSTVACVKGRLGDLTLADSKGNY